MNKINEIVFDNKRINKNDIIDMLDNLTNVEYNIVFNKLYYTNTYGYTFLQAIYRKYYNNDILIYLLKKYKDNININVKNSQGKTLLFYIAYNRDIEILEYIYELYEDVNINILNNDGENILYYIIIHSCYDEKIMRFLLEKNIRIQYKLLKYTIDLCEYENMNILLEYIYINDNQYDYVLEELYKYVIENYKINEDNREFYDKIFIIKSNTKSAAKIQ